MSEANHYQTSQDRETILAIAAPALIPLIKQRQDSILSQLLGEFHAGTQDLRPTVAMYAAYTNIIRDCEALLRKRDSQGKD